MKAFGSLVVALCVACGSGGGATNPDAGDAASSDVTIETGPAPGNYHALTDPSSWTFYDLGTIAGRFGGGTYDGRYVYLAPARAAANVYRYDTQAAFDQAASWTPFSLQKLNSGATVFGGGGASFDGRYVYFPNQAQAGYVFRYDATLTFDQAGSWTGFDVGKTFNCGLEGGTAFDGRYMYFVVGGYQQTGMVRVDTQKPFSDAASWEYYSGLALGSLMINGDTGAVFDGRYVYVVPAGETAVRYDTQAPFASDGSWSKLGVPATNAEFFGGVFDGRYVFLVPYLDIKTGSTVQRLDTQNANAGWSGFDTSQLDPTAGGFTYGAFDGRYVYFSPSFSQVTQAIDGLLVRYDTGADFASVGSWSKLDLATLNPSAKDFAGAVFDGTYVYFVPDQNHVVARFDARDPPFMPSLPGFHGSFF